VLPCGCRRRASAIGIPSAVGASMTRRTWVSHTYIYIHMYICIYIFMYICYLVDAEGSCQPSESHQRRARTRRNELKRRIHIYIYIYIYICIYVYLNIFIYIYIYMHVHTNTYIYIYTLWMQKEGVNHRNPISGGRNTKKRTSASHTYIYIYIYMYICIYKFMYICYLVDAERRRQPSESHQWRARAWRDEFKCRRAPRRVVRLDDFPEPAYYRRVRVVAACPTREVYIYIYIYIYINIYMYIYIQIHIYI